MTRKEWEKRTEEYVRSVLPNADSPTIESVVLQIMAEFESLIDLED